MHYIPHRLTLECLLLSTVARVERVFQTSSLKIMRAQTFRVHILFLLSKKRMCKLADTHTAIIYRCRIAAATFL